MAIQKISEDEPDDRNPKQIGRKVGIGGALALSASMNGADWAPLDGKRRKYRSVAEQELIRRGRLKKRG